jgi:hypothetical protein
MQVLYIPCAVHGHDSAARVTLLTRVALATREVLKYARARSRNFCFLLLRYLRHTFTSGIVGSFVGERSNKGSGGKEAKVARGRLRSMDYRLGKRRNVTGRLIIIAEHTQPSSFRCRNMMGMTQDIPMEWHMPMGNHVQVHLGFVSALRASCGRVVLARLCVSLVSEG